MWLSTMMSVGWSLVVEESLVMRGASMSRSLASLDPRDIPAVADKARHTSSLNDQAAGHRA